MGPARGETYYVSPYGADADTGAESSPFRHFSKAAAAARNPGDTVVALDGTYDNEGAVSAPGALHCVVALRFSGTAAKPITFRALHRGGAILDAGNRSSRGCNGAWAYFDLGNAAYVVIQGFVIENGCYNGIRSNGSSHDVTIRWNEVRNIGNWDNPAGRLSPSGIYLNHTEYNFTFDGNTFHDIGGGTNGNQQHAIYSSASLVTIVNNIFYNVTHGWAIQSAGGNGLLIANNTFAFPNPHRTGQIALWDGGRPGSLANVIIRNNIFYKPIQFAVVTTLVAPVSGTCWIDHNLTTAGSVYDDASPCQVRGNRTGIDPEFARVSAAPYDFGLSPGSPAIGAGVAVPGIGWDFDGTARAPRRAFDLGALQRH